MGLGQAVKKVQRRLALGFPEEEQAQLAGVIPTPSCVTRARIATFVQASWE